MDKQEFQAKFLPVCAAGRENKRGAGRPSSPEVTLDEANGLYFSASVTKSMGEPERVMVCINPADKQLAIVPINDPEMGKAPNVYTFIDEKRRMRARQLPVRWTKKTLLDPIYEMTGLDRKIRYTIPVDHDFECDAYIIDFNRAEVRD